MEPTRYLRSTGRCAFALFVSTRYDYFMASAQPEVLSESMQMYLKAIGEIQDAKGAARVKDIAQAVGVNKASVTSALRNLSSRELINYAPYDLVTLTPEGHEIAAELSRRYEIVKSFLMDVLGIDEVTADDDACAIEHHVSPDLHDRLVGFIDYYQHCTSSKFRWDPDLGNFCTDPDD